MQSRFFQALIHALKVGLHHLAAVLVIGAVVYLDHNKQLSVQFAAYAEHFGISVAVANMIFSGALKYLQTKLPADITIDSLPQ